MSATVVTGPTRFATYGDFRVGALQPDGSLYDVCAVAHGRTETSIDHPRLCLPEVVRRWPELRDGALAQAAVLHPVIRAPIPRPVNVFGAPVNYREHEGELGPTRSPAAGTVRELGLFVKASGSVSGPDAAIELPPLEGREFHYEGEIAVVIGRGGHDLDEDEARRAILGVTGALDVTMRLEENRREERSMRKSFRTFTPMGPALLPLGDSVDLESLSLELSLNGQVRQRGCLGQLIVNVVGLVQLASSIVRLEPGDVILTGTPAGVGPLAAGDRVELVVSGLPPLRLEVAR
jgi:2-keto-4-pentenoate hydratase/2-oxohepta-3-ene-1,7-dioic acid hydratase in catechol pathway